MSLFIDVERINRILLPDGWHDIKLGSFLVDAYEFVETGSNPNSFTLLFGGGTSSLIPSSGFSVIDQTGVRIVGPLTSILAVSQT